MGISILNLYQTKATVERIACTRRITVRGNPVIRMMLAMAAELVCLGQANSHSKSYTNNYNELTSLGRNSAKQDTTPGFGITTTLKNRKSNQFT